MCVFIVWNDTANIKKDKTGSNVLDVKGGSMTSVQNEMLYFLFVKTVTVIIKMTK